MGPRCSSTETQVCHRRYIIAASVLHTTLCDKVVFPVTPVPSTRETDCHDITEILFYVALNTINLTLTLYKYKPKRCIARAEFNPRKQ
jgi:hypothetical protein